MQVCHYLIISQNPKSLTLAWLDSDRIFDFGFQTFAIFLADCLFVMQIDCRFEYKLGWDLDRGEARTETRAQ